MFYLSYAALDFVYDTGSVQNLAIISSAVGYGQKSFSILVPVVRGERGGGQARVGEGDGEDNALIPMSGATKDTAPLHIVR